MNKRLSADLIYEALHTANIVGTKPTLEALVKLRENQNDERSSISNMVIESCCKHYKISVRKLLQKNSKDSKRNYAISVISHLLQKREIAGLTQPEIGKLLGGLDKTLISRKATSFRTFSNRIKDESDAIYIASLIEQEVAEYIKQNELNETNND